MQIDVDNLLYICGVIMTISAAAAVLAKVLKNAIIKTTSQSIKHEIATLSDTFDAQLIQLTKQLQEHQQSNEHSNELIRKSLLSITRDRINQAHDFYMSEGAIGAHSLFVLEELYTSYKSLGGNSFIDKQMDDLRSLEVYSDEIRRKHRQQ